MAQVLIERPRYGSRIRGYRRQRCINRQTPLDDAPRREAIRRRAGGRNKYFSDLFGPLLRYLASNVGRPWSKVYAEICRHNDLRSPAQKHLRHHIFDFVECTALLIDGVPYRADGCYALTAFRRNQFYVCPRTGLLRLAESSRPRESVGSRIQVSETRQYHRVEGVWCEVTLRKIPADREGCVDALLGKPLLKFRPGEAYDTYGAAVYALSRRPLGKADARRIVDAEKTRLRRNRKKRRSGVCF